MVNILANRVSSEVIRQQGPLSAACLQSTEIGAGPALARALYTALSTIGMADAGVAASARGRVLGMSITPMVLAATSGAARPSATAVFAAQQAPVAPLSGTAALLTKHRQVTGNTAGQLPTNRHLTSGHVLDPHPE
ncbi:hypothetical protein MXD61_19665 [Frankia sp. AgPm24]|uniref:hypothetical protein n=1 Tax=Frankia sp. AgPm24 TaxID=631128 RepID=UPI00200D28FF|nr:hypothetical protein [Frankia sp. AgPm24]MCK9924056.1 hypothetical protein [Frankia sp. AgPm24]